MKMTVGNDGKLYYVNNPEPVHGDVVTLLRAIIVQLEAIKTSLDLLRHGMADNAQRSDSFYED